MDLYKIKFRKPSSQASNYFFTFGKNTECLSLFWPPEKSLGRVINSNLKNCETCVMSLISLHQRKSKSNINLTKPKKDIQNPSTLKCPQILFY